MFLGIDDYEIWQLVLACLILLGSSLLQGVIGFGAGTFGIPLLIMAGFDYPTAMTVILMIAVVVIGIELVSGWARTKIIGEQR